MHYWNSLRSRSHLQPGLAATVPAERHVRHAAIPAVGRRPHHHPGRHVWRAAGQRPGLLGADDSLGQDLFGQQVRLQVAQQFQSSRGAAPFAFAHVGGRYADLRMHDPAIELAVEVHSAWGTFEWLIEDAMETILRHTGKPCAGYLAPASLANRTGWEFVKSCYSR